jgi:hypothetical protein
LTSGNNTTNQKVYTTASIAPAPNALVTLAVLGHRSAGATSSPKISGGGMTTWEEVATVTLDPLSTPLKRLTVYRAMSASPGSGSITIAFENNVSNAQWIVSQWQGVDASGTNGSGATVQTGSGRANTVTGLTVTLAPFQNAGNVAYGVFAVRSSTPAVTPGAGFAEIAEHASSESPAADLQAQWTSNDNTINATWPSANGAGLGIEIRAGQGGVTPEDPPQEDPPQEEPPQEDPPQEEPPPVTTGPDPLKCTGYPQPRVWLESQAWWDNSGLAIPSKVGSHIHMGMCWPVDAEGGSAIVSDGAQLDIRYMVHDQIGATNYQRWSTDGGVFFKEALEIPTAADATVWYSKWLDVGPLSTGRREFKFHLNIPNNAEGARQFVTSGWQLCVRSCSPSYRSGHFTEGSGWYDDGHDYANVSFRSALPVRPVSGTWTFTIRTSRAFGGVYVDPDFHHGSAGTTIATYTSSGSKTVTINTATLSNGPHRLVLLSHDGKNGGVLVVAFTVANP